MTNLAIFLCGPTAVGKTDIALRLSKQYPLEIISVDSALIYKDMNIGTAKPSQQELSQVPHHLIDIISPLENYSVMEFIKDCNNSIIEINNRGKIPILVGGTMMYYNALINGISQLPEADPDLRKQLDDDFVKYGTLAMHNKLSKLDSFTASKISPQDKQRIQRALEVCILTNKPMSIAQEDCRLPGLINCKYHPLAIVPSNRAMLHERINLRFDKMLQTGFIEEVEQLKLSYPELTPEHNSMRCVGYKQVWSYLCGQLNYEGLLDAGKAATRQLAKRQVTWLRSMPIIQVDEDKLDINILESKISNLINGFLS